MILLTAGGEQLRKCAAISDDMIQAIDRWEQLYHGNMPWKNDITPSGMNLPCKIAFEIATKVTNEAKIRIQEITPETGSKGQSKKPSANASSVARWEYINRVFEPIRKRLAIYTEYACAFGGICFKPYLNGKNEIAVSVYTASRFYPTAFTAAQTIQSGFFIDQVKKGDSWYYRIENHEWDGIDTLRVTNTCYKSNSKDSLGSPCNLTDVEDWANILPVTEMKDIHSPLFAYFGIPIGNTIDQTSPLGVSVYERAIENIEEADKQYSRFLWEFEAGEIAVDISEDALQIDSNGNPIVPKGKERVFRINSLPVTAGDLIKVFAPALRDSSYAKGIQTILKIVEDDAALARGSFSDPEKDAKTATEIVTQKWRSYNTVTRIQKALDDALRELAKAVDTMISLYNLCPAGGWEYSASWDDSILEDSGTERMHDREDVAAGLMAAWEYRVKWYGETEEQAKKILVEMKSKSDDDIMGFNTEPQLGDGKNT